jgi:hypothetical protein
LIPVKNQPPLVLGLLERDSRTISKAKLVGLMAAARDIGTISKSKMTISDMLFP